MIFEVLSIISFFLIVCIFIILYKMNKIYSYLLEEFERIDRWIITLDNEYIELKNDIYNKIKGENK